MSFFNSAYLGTPPWDIGRPQREFVKLAAEGQINGAVVDLGCGTGENAMMFASHGNRVLGVDAAPLAISKAREKGAERGSSAEFLVADALDLSQVKRIFDTATDCGLFHTFSDRERTIFSKTLHKALAPGGKYFMLCFSDREPADWGGPRRVTQGEIKRTFSRGWRVDWIREARFEATHLGQGGHAWLSRVTKLSSKSD